METIGENSQSYVEIPACKHFMAFIYNMVPKYKIPKKTSDSSKIKSSSNKSSRDFSTLVSKVMANVMQKVDRDSSRKAKKAKKAMWKKEMMAQNQEYKTKNESLQKVLVAYQHAFDSSKVQNQMLKLVGQMLNCEFLGQLEEVFNKASEYLNFKSQISNIADSKFLIDELFKKMMNDSKQEYLVNLPPWQLSAVLRLIHEDQVAELKNNNELQSDKDSENSIQRRIIPIHSNNEFLAWRKKQVRKKQTSQGDQNIDLSDSVYLSQIIESPRFQNIILQDIKTILECYEQFLSFQRCKQQTSQFSIEIDMTFSSISHYLCLYQPDLEQSPLLSQL